MTKSMQEKITDILMNYLPKNGVSKTRDELCFLFTTELKAEREVYKYVFKKHSLPVATPKKEIRMTKKEETKYLDVLNKYLQKNGNFEYCEFSGKKYRSLLINRGITVKEFTTLTPKECGKLGLDTMLAIVRNKFTPKKSEQEGEK